jgi:hypothetical protein
VRWNSIRQFQEGLQRILVCATIIFHLCEMLRPTDRRQNRNWNDINQLMAIVFIIPTRVREFCKAIENRMFFFSSGCFSGDCEFILLRSSL